MGQAQQDARFGSKIVEIGDKAHLPWDRPTREASIPVVKFLSAQNADTFIPEKTARTRLEALPSIRRGDITAHHNDR